MRMNQDSSPLAFQGGDGVLEQETKSPRIGAPQDVESYDRLIHGGLIIASCALADAIDKRFRWLAYGIGGFMAASAFTGWTPLSPLLRYAGLKSRSELDGAEEGSSGEDDLAVPHFGIERKAAVAAPQPRLNGSHSRHHEMAGVGVPHRIPFEELAPRERPIDVDDRPAPHPSGDLGLADD